MIKWINLTEEQKRTSISQAALKSGAAERAIEKDWWVTLTLKALFTGPYAQSLVFKGGTSLSKCYNLIQRFSEDIDIVLDPQLLGMEYQEAPTKSFLNKLRRGGCKFTTTELLKSVETGLISIGVPKGLLTIYAEEVPANMPDKDPQTIYIVYPSLYESSNYIKNIVKIEVGVRAKIEPFSMVLIESMLNQFFPNKAYGEEPFEVRAVDARKTFIEKACLLHEELRKPDRARIRTERMSRHFYDLVRMMDTDICVRALADKELYASIIKHRSFYNKMPGVDYQLLEAQTIDFVPDGELMEAFSKDYENMLKEMIYGESIEPKNLFERIRALQSTFRNGN